MEIHYATLETCGAATDTVVAIDICRAFTSAPFAFAAGASEIILVSTIEEAFALRERLPGALLMGEMGGLPIEGFD
jgi:2-phosphosulfolactate phosphatase